MLPGESTATRLLHPKDPARPTVIRGPGNYRTIEHRHLELTRFARPVLADIAGRAADNGHGPDRVLTNSGSYAPGDDQGGKSAAGILDRCLKLWGLNHADVTAASITKWRSQTALDAGGIDAASKIAGSPHERTCQMLNQEEPLAEANDSLGGSLRWQPPSIFSWSRS